MGSSRHQVVLVLVDSIKSVSCPSVISISWLINSGVNRPEVLDKGADTQAIYDHDQGISLGHPLLVVEEVTRRIAFPDHQGRPVAIVVKYKLHITVPLMAHHPQHDCVVLLVERITRVNE